jgi:hypothetical protein
VSKVFKVNLDYEASLFDPDYDVNGARIQKINNEFEYIFFLINQEVCTLKNSKNYSKKYIQHLKQNNFSIPIFEPNAKNFEFWWGRLQDLEMERFFNSKLNSAKIAFQNNWGFAEGRIVVSLNELKDHINSIPEKENWLIKRAHGFSGIGHFNFNSKSLNEEVLLKILTEKVLLEPIYERVFDIGTTFEIKNGEIIRHFMVENFNSKSGSFNGGAGSSNVDKFKKYIFEKYSYSLDELEEITKNIAQYYLNIGATSNIQIDSFVYLENNKLKLYSLVEINYRKTMGLVIQSLADRNPNADWIEWRVSSAKNFEEQLIGNHWLKLSPEENHFQSYFCAFSFT